MKFTVMIVQLSKILTKNLGKIDLLVSKLNQKSRICASSGSVDSSRRITYDKYRDRKSLSQYIYLNIFRLTMDTDTTGAMIDIATGLYTSKASGVFKAELSLLMSGKQAASVWIEVRKGCECDHIEYKLWN